MSDQRVVVVTGGGAGIGAAVAEELGRQGCFVVTVDPLLTIDGSAPLESAEPTTADRIVAAGGSARASAASVTDGPAIVALFEALVAEHGRLDAVINVAGITRPTSYSSGTDEDWRDVLDVHLNGYLHVLAAALPIMAAAGRGQIVGVTSGSGWRAADAGAYSCAKRAVAALTWQLGQVTPPGVTVNAMSPIAVTRMVTAALERAAAAAAARPGGAGSATGGLSLGSMPEPEELGPFGAHLVDDSLRSWLRGQVLFAGGPEVAVIEPPRLLEALRTDGIESVPAALEAVSAGAFVPAEASQQTSGATNPRFATALSEPGELSAGDGGTAVIVSDRPTEAASIAAALEARGIAVHLAGALATTLDDAVATLAAVADLDAVIVAADRSAAATSGSPWERVLADHAELVDEIERDTVWSRAATTHATASGRPLRLVTVTDASRPGGRSRAQAVAQLSRSSRRTTKDAVAGFSVSMEGSDAVATAALVAHLVTSPDAAALSGAELATGDGWIGLRSHPRPLGSVVLGEGGVPGWLDGVLRDIVGAPAEETP